MHPYESLKSTADQTLPFAIAQGMKNHIEAEIQRVPNPSEQDVRLFTDQMMVLASTFGPQLKVSAHQSIADNNLPTPVTVQGIAAVPVASIGPIQLTRTAAPATEDLALWGIIRSRTRAVDFTLYRDFVQGVVERSEVGPRSGNDDDRMMRAERIVRSARGFGTEGYEFLRELTEAFLLSQSGVVPTIDHSDRRGRVVLQGRADEDAPGPITRVEHEPRLPSEVDDGRGQDHVERLTDIGFPGTALELEDRLFDHLASVKNTRLSPWIKVVLSNLKALRRRQDGTYDVTSCFGIVPGMTKGPLFLELIWSYWHEEGNVPRTMRAIATRFQNKSPGPNDPLAGLELAPLRDVSNLLWGYVQNDYNRLTRERRSYEYEHEYGMQLTGPQPRGEPADRRSAFVAAFHALLRECTAFYLQDDHTTVVSDAFPVLNALKDVHLILSQGAHNQYGDLPWTSRVEMLTEMYILALPELREYLGNRPMVPYPEAWMGQVEGVRSMYRWGAQPVLHFSNLGRFGEQLLLSIRHNNWLNFNDPNSAKNWAKYWRPEVQGYVHAYRAVRGIDLSAGVDAVALDSRGLLASPRRLRTRRT